MWNALRTFEAGDFSSWLREGNFIAEPFAAYYVLLGLHSIGMAIVVGLCLILSSRILGFQLLLSMSAARSVLKLAWWGFYLNLASGLLLILAQPRREFMTPLFWVKMAVIVMSLVSMLVMQRGLSAIRPVAARGGASVEMAPWSARVSAVLVTLGWLLAIVAGRLVGYTQPPPPL